MPLLKAKPGAIPRKHDACRDEKTRCVECDARKYLVPADWRVIRYWYVVQDQVVNLTPQGLEGGGWWLAPRLEAWIACCDMLGIEQKERLPLIDAARALHEMVHGRNRSALAFAMDPALLAPLEE